MNQSQTDRDMAAIQAQMQRTLRGIQKTRQAVQFVATVLAAAEGAWPEVQTALEKFVRVGKTVNDRLTEVDRMVQSMTDQQTTEEEC